MTYVARNLVARPRSDCRSSSRAGAAEIPVGRLRAQGELAELRTRDLQFSTREIPTCSVGAYGRSPGGRRPCGASSRIRGLGSVLGADPDGHPRPIGSRDRFIQIAIRRGQPSCMTTSPRRSLVIYPGAPDFLWGPRSGLSHHSGLGRAICEIRPMPAARGNRTVRTRNLGGRPKVGGLNAITRSFTNSSPSPPRPHRRRRRHIPPRGLCGVGRGQDWRTAAYHYSAADIHRMHRCSRSSH